MAQELIKYDTAGALMKVLECEPWVLSLKTGTCRERAFISIREAVEYIYYGCKAFALSKCGSTAEAKKVLLYIPNLESMEEKQKSGIYGVKACAFMEYGLQGFLKALEYVSIARTMNPAMAEWHFLTGKLMSRIRHVKYPNMTAISDEEENFYRTAYNLDTNEPSYALYMAQIKREKANGLFQEVRYDREAYENSFESIGKMNEEASSLYMMLIQTNQNDPYILGRCAFGMAKLPIPYKRLDLAEDAIAQALRISPENPLVNHYAGLLYHRFLNDNKKGFEYLERAASKNNYPANLDWIRLKYLDDPENYDPLPELIKGLEYDEYTTQTQSEIGSWYFFKKDNVVCAWNHIKEITDDHNVLNYKSNFLSMKSVCNLLEVIFDEVKLKLAELKYKDKQEKEELMLISKQLQKLCPQSHPTDYKNLKSIILLDSDAFMSRKGNEWMRPGARNRTAQGREKEVCWRSTMGNKESFSQNGSRFSMGDKLTKSWRTSGTQMESSNCSRDMTNSNYCTIKKQGSSKELGGSWRSSPGKINSLNQNDSRILMGGRSTAESWRNTGMKQHLLVPSSQTETSNSRDMKYSNGNMKQGGKKGINDSWRSSSGNINSLIQNGSSSMRGTATESWRNTDPNQYQLAPGNLPQSSNTSIVNRNSNMEQSFSSSKINKENSTDRDFTDTASPSTADYNHQKQKAGLFNPKSNIHHRPIYFQKHTTNFNNNL